MRIRYVNSRMEYPRSCDRVLVVIDRPVLRVLLLSNNKIGVEKGVCLIAAAASSSSSSLLLLLRCDTVKIIPF
jgi:hypothetical protein